MVSKKQIVFLHCEDFFYRYGVQFLVYFINAINFGDVSHVIFLFHDLSRETLTKVKSLLQGSPSSLYQYTSPSCKGLENEKLLVETIGRYRERQEAIVLISGHQFNRENLQMLQQNGVKIKTPILLHNGNAPTFVFNEQTQLGPVLCDDSSKPLQNVNNSPSSSSSQTDYNTLCDLFGDRLVEKLWPKLKDLNSLNDRLKAIAYYVEKWKSKKKL